MKLYFIINPAAKNGLSLRVWNKVEKQLKHQHIYYQAYFTKCPGDGIKQVKKILQNTKDRILIIAVGGDGTIHEILNGVYPMKNGIVGYIPAGSGNDFVRGYRLPRNPKKATEHILHLLGAYKKIPIARNVDCGRFQVKASNRGCFFNNLGVGFDATVAKKVNESKVKRIYNKLGLGKLIYLLFLLKVLFIYKPTRIKMNIDGQIKVFERVWLVTVSNQPYFGGGLKIAPDAVVDDGFLDVTVVYNITRWKILLLFITVLWGGHRTIKGVYFTKGKKIFIETDKTIPIHADGEYKGDESVSVQVKEKAVSLLNGIETRHL
ncbi:diacylglycerol kinase family lipid kinase [Caldibacillus thermolactis]|uniref:Diacylglycerol kinase family lipid kinase n=1 Tax=Pallidibacillus thermolactis TaxID=251051 RepID=A0ABT2WKB8_9BACI|nr:diacylglycerol kinase family protein [Pallidibacillus thermolactis]MCU9595169.1 diacylglycerol kinase family lipid kinase [Pallidibacillus thermolactis]MCU9601070.1 diacylglycerol kinase family lipid kinase [Pallidibacillus thermolactis subsp. kokeshiiformis]MED1672266.1 diacylglycerol kinase family lipid kinase [Pallidibacillus thermolactis subsp. kokeshiiformis]